MPRVCKKLFQFHNNIDLKITNESELNKKTTFK